MRGKYVEMTSSSTLRGAKTGLEAFDKSLFLINFREMGRMARRLRLQRLEKATPSRSQEKPSFMNVGRGDSMPNHAVWNPSTGQSDLSNRLQSIEGELENDLENRLRNLDKLVDSIAEALQRERFSGKPRALDLVNDLRVKIKANQNMFRVGKLLSEPARHSVISKVCDSLNDLEQFVASNLGVEMSKRH
jgi:hypothetical protein